MFGIGLPEMLLIMALALIVIGPDKLPDLARSLAKGLMDLKKTAESLKASFAEEGNPLSEIRPELEEAANSLKNNLLDVTPGVIDFNSSTNETSPANMAAEAYQELLKQTAGNPQNNSDKPENSAQKEPSAPDSPDPKDLTPPDQPVKADS
jgi:sec-independent protein translocase protein TatB